VRRLLPTGFAGVAALALAIVAISSTALAYFTTTGAGQVAAPVTKLLAPTITAATPAAGGTVTLTWSAVSAPGTGTVTYYVRRDGGAPAGDCPASGSPTTVLTCTDTGLSVATHSYTVTAVWRSWTAVSSVSNASVTIGPATKFTITAASSTPAAGATDILTITAKDASGSTVPTYTGSHSLTFSGALASPGGTAPTVADASGTDIAFGTAIPITFTAGVAAAAAGANGEMTLYKSGATSITVTDGSLTTPTPLAVTVAPGTATNLTLAAVTLTPVAAAADNLTITALDTYGNTATAYTGAKSLTFSGALASPSGALPTVANSSGTAINFGAATAITFSAGIAAVTTTKNGVLKLNKAGPTSVTATDGTISTATPLALTVSVGTAARLGLVNTVASAGSIASPCLFTCAVTLLGNSGTISANVAVTDSVGNTVSALGTGHTVKVTVTAGGTISGSPLTIEPAGPAISSAKFIYTAPASEAFAHTITAAALTGTAYTSATATASK
jgi:hypothetical protein